MTIDDSSDLKSLSNSTFTLKRVRPELVVTNDHVSSVRYLIKILSTSLKFEIVVLVES